MMIRIFAVATAVSVLALAGCDRAAPQKAAEPVEAAPSATTPAAPADQVADTVLTPTGMGAMRIGMTRAELDAAMGPDSDPQSVGGPDPQECDMYRPTRAPEGVLVMVEGGVLTSIWVQRGSAVKTGDGFGVGDALEALKAKYGARAVFSNHKYVEAPSGYLTTWVGVDRPTDVYVENPAARGLMYEIGPDNKVVAIAAGGPSIQYVEGCA